MGITDLVTQFRFYVLDHRHLAEDIFISESDKAISRVSRNPTRENVEVLLQYATADEVVPVVEGYLTKEIKSNSWDLNMAFQERSRMRNRYGQSIQRSSGNWRSSEDAIRGSMRIGGAQQEVEKYARIRDVLTAQLTALKTGGLEEFLQYNNPTIRQISEPTPK